MEKFKEKGHNFDSKTDDVTNQRITTGTINADKVILKNVPVKD